MHVFLLWDRANNFLVSLLMSKLKIDKNDEKKSALILYSLSCLLNEAGKIAVLTVFFLVQRRWAEFITAFITIASLRIFLGGSHRKTILGCWMQSFLTFETIILLSAKISVNGYTFCPILLLGLFLIWKELPLISDQRTIYGEAQCMRFKSKSLTIIVILLMLIYYVPYCIGNVMLWTMCFQILESLLVVLYRKFQGSSL